MSVPDSPPDILSGWNERELAAAVSIRERMQGVGEATLSFEEVRDLWRDYSASMDAQWMSVKGWEEFGCFAGYLAGEVLTLRSRLATVEREWEALQIEIARRNVLFPESARRD